VKNGVLKQSQNKFRTNFAVSRGDCGVYPERRNRDCFALLAMTKLYPEVSYLEVAWPRNGEIVLF